MMVATAKWMRSCDLLVGGNFTGPFIHRGSVEKIEGYNQLAKKEGAKVLLDGGRMTQGEHGVGCYMAPFIYKMEHRPDARALREEVFGPHLALIPFKTNEDAVRIYNDTPYGLSMAGGTEGYRNMRSFRDGGQYGRGYMNLPGL